MKSLNSTTSSLSIISLCVIILMLFSISSAGAQATVVLASKADNETPIISAIAQQYLANHNIDTQYYSQMGPSRLLFEALLNGEIDVYTEYTGTLTQELLSQQNLVDLNELVDYLDTQGLAMTAPLGFSNNFGFAMRQEDAAKLGITRLSQLADYPDLKYSVSTEFMGRADGWRNMAQLYHLTDVPVTTLDKALAYQAVSIGRSDVTEVYTTDAEISANDLVVLEDDRDYFNDYQAIYLYRQDLADKNLAAISYLQQLTGHFELQQVQAMNQAFFAGTSAETIAANFLRNTFAIDNEVTKINRWQELGQLTTEHLILVIIPLVVGFIVSMLLAIIAYWWPRIGSIIMGIIGVVQTTPALALLVFMIPLFGIGTLPAVVALLLYSLLPMVRSTLLGFRNIEDKLSDTAAAMGLSKSYRLWRVDLPLALPAIIDGARTACVLLIGFATLGAIIGAGGYGQAILTGIRLNQPALIWLGAIPAALMALLAQGLFFWLERMLISRGLQLHRNINN